MPAAEHSVTSMTPSWHPDQPDSGTNGVLARQAACACQIRKITKGSSRFGLVTLCIPGSVINDRRVARDDQFVVILAHGSLTLAVRQRFVVAAHPCRGAPTRLCLLPASQNMEASIPW